MPERIAEMGAKALIQPRHSAMAERTLLIPMLGQ